MFESRVQGLADHVANEAGFEPSTQLVVADVVEIFQEVDRMLDAISYPAVFSGRNFLDIGNELLDNLRYTISDGNEENLLQWVRTACSVLSTHVAALNAMDLVMDANSRGILSRTALVDQQTTSLLDQAALRASAKRLTEELQDSVVKARDAAGTVGNASLSSHFANYADQEVRSANRFRAFAIAGFTVALVFALLFGNGKNGWLLTFQSDWTALAFKVAGAAGIGSISAYLARQAGQHRRMSNWARSMAVQLQSFPAFIEPLGYEKQAEMYDLLARRVFTAPPEKSGNTSDDSVGAAQLLEVVTALARRSNTTWQ
jgi:hypothetical protein